MSRVRSISSVTGVDLELAIAGPGARSYAFVVDWHIRLLAALAWFFLATELAGVGLFADGNGAMADNSGALFFYIVTLPSLVIYFLYHPVIELLMSGRTPGKRMAGVRIVKRDGSLPGVGAILVRNIFRLIDSLPVFYCVGLATTVSNRESLRIGDIAAGTLLIYDSVTPKGVTQSFSSAALECLGVEQAEAASDLVARWDELRPNVRIELATRLLTLAGRLPADAQELDFGLRSELNNLLLVNGDNARAEKL